MFLQRILLIKLAGERNNEEWERISLSLCNIWNSFSCWADDKTWGWCRGSVLFWQCCLCLQKRGMVLLWDNSCIQWLKHSEPAQSTSELSDGIRNWVQDFQLCYEHKKICFKIHLQKRSRCLCPFNKFPSGLCDNLGYFFFWHPVHFSSGNKSQKANLFLLIDAVTWVFICAENPLAQPVVAQCHQTQFCSGIEGGQYLLFSNPCPHYLCDLGAEWCIDWGGKEDGFCCNKLINVVKRLGFALLFMGFFGLSNGIFILDLKKMSSYQERMWELPMQRT